MPDPLISIVIRSYNEERHIGRLLDGIMHQTLIDQTEIILVDSGSTDRTVEIAEQYPVQVVHIRPEDFSFGYSLNVGCAAASGEYLVFASAHVYPVYKDWLEKLTAPFADERVAVAYGKQRGDENSKYSEHRVFETWFPDGPGGIQDHPFSNNANAAVRRAVWQQMPYDETLTGLEDLAWAKQAMARGWRVAYAPEAVIVHIHEETLPRIYNRYRREAIALNGIYPDQRFTLWDFVRLFTANVVSDLSHAASDGVLWRAARSIVTFRLMQFWGTYRGFQQRDPVSAALKQTFYYPTIRRSPQPEPDPAEEARRIDYVSPAAEDTRVADH